MRFTRFADASAACLLMSAIITAFASPYFAMS